MKQLLLLLLLLPLLTGLSAQEDDVALVMSADGELVYQPVGGAPFKVYTGTYLVGAGELRVGTPASIEISRQGKFVRLDRAGTYQLQDLFAARPESPGFLTRFTNFIRRGVDQSETQAGLEKEYLKNQANAQGNIRGLGDAGLVGYLPFGGRLPAGEQSFAWPAVTDAPNYTFRIIDSATQQVVLSAETQGPAIDVDLGQLDLKDGRRYFWQATPQELGGRRRLGVGGGTAAPALRIHFTFADRPAADIRDEITPQLAALTEQGPTTWALAEAMLLEEAGYLAAADGAYRSAIESANDPLVAKRAYATFLARWNLRRAAADLIEE